MKKILNRLLPALLVLVCAFVWPLSALAESCNMPGCPEICGEKDCLDERGNCKCGGPNIYDDEDDAGNTGDEGDTGNAGDTGDTGNTGSTGDTGDTGNTGKPDDTGDTGNTGKPDDTGDTGSTGKPDDTGDTGSTGKPDGTGDTGSTGKPDGTGDTGSTGKPDGTGDTGSAGNTGETGDIGDAPAPVILPYADVQSGDWYYSAVAYMYETGIMTGTSATTFMPAQIVNRATIVTMLHRLEGTPTAGSAGFPDVAGGQWYTAAVDWAAANGVVTGYDNGNFGPGDTITREQMAVILYRYAQLKGYGTSAAGSLSGYTDAASVSAYAAQAMQWAVGSGLITSASTSALVLNPQGSATRAEIATILMRFMENIH